MAVNFASLSHIVSLYFLGVSCWFEVLPWEGWGWEAGQRVRVWGGCCDQIFPYLFFRSFIGSVILSVTLAGSASLSASVLLSVLFSCLQMFLWLTNNFSGWQLVPSDGSISLLSVNREVLRALIFLDADVFWQLIVLRVCGIEKYCWFVFGLAIWSLGHLSVVLPQGWWPHSQRSDDALRHQQENHQAQEETGESHEGAQGEERAPWLPIFLASSFWHTSPVVALLV